MLAAALLRPFCRHRETLLKVDEKRHRLYTECVKCLSKSPGISTDKAFERPRPSSQRMRTAALNQMLGIGIGGGNASNL